MAMEVKHPLKVKMALADTNTLLSATQDASKPLDIIMLLISILEIMMTCTTYEILRRANLTSSNATSLSICIIVCQEVIECSLNPDRRHTLQ